MDAKLVANHGIPFQFEEVEMRIRKMKIVLMASALAVGLLGSVGASAAVDTFLKIDGIDGESTDDKHKGEIDVFAWSWSVAATTPGKRGCIKGMAISKAFDSASPRLITNAATGAGAPKAVLTLRKAGRDQQEFLVITMSNVLVSSYSVGGASGQDGVLENVVLNFELMDGAYKKQKPDGSLGPAIPWNIGPSAGKCANND